MQKGILGRKHILLTMTEEIHALLGKKYTIPILRELKHSGPLGFREIDVKVVGATGSSNSTRSTLVELMNAGWVGQEKRRSKYIITDLGQQVLAYVAEGEKIPVRSAKKIYREENG